MDEMVEKLKGMSQRKLTTLKRVGSKAFVFPNCKYAVGDILWVREAFLKLEKRHIIYSPFVYRAETNVDSEEIRLEYVKSGYPYKWKPAIHMPFEAARFFLRIKSIKAERLQEISQNDAIAEGIQPTYASRYLNYIIPTQSFTIPKYSFESLWCKINGYESWADNPWVWVIEFEQIPKEEALKEAGR